MHPHRARRGSHGAGERIDPAASDLKAFLT